VYKVNITFNIAAHTNSTAGARPK